MFMFSLASAQTSSVYSFETEYTTQFGYRYFMTKLNTQTGFTTRLSQLPVKGHYTGVRSFMNHDDHFVFLGLDSTSLIPYLYKVYELDTMGNLINSFIVNNTAPNQPGPELLYLFQAKGCPLYYGITWDANANRNLVSINPATGINTVLATASTPNSGAQYGAARDGDNNIYFLQGNSATGYTNVMKASVLNGTIMKTDSFPISDHIFNLFYDCGQDTIYGFYGPISSTNMNGTQWIKIDPSTGKIIYTGTTISSAGTFMAHTTLANGQYYQLNGYGSAVQFAASSVSGPVYNATSGPSATALLNLIAASPVSCNYNYDCAVSSVQAMANDLSFPIYPNPSIDHVTFKFNSNSTVSLSIFNSIGELVHSCNVTGSSYEYSLSSLAAGVYYVRAVIDGEMRTAKFFVQK
jgi:hypothetical protein